ncbi:MAG: signal peptidase II [Clostridiales bacterium]|nr:signal peptidase II [Clostridiales bacterium]
MNPDNEKNRADEEQIVLPHSDRAETDDENVAADGAENAGNETGELPARSAADTLKKFGRAAWAYIKHARIELIVAVALLALDLITKAIVAHNMYVGQSVEIIPQFLYFTYVRNTKAAFGSAFGLEKALGDDAIRIIFLVITVLAVGVFCWLLYRCRKRHILMRVSIALIIAGAIGNFIDRLCLHYVRDFVEIVFFGCDVPLLGESFAIFNIADVGLTVGVILFLIYFIVIYKEPKAKPTTVNGQTDVLPESGEAESAPTNDGQASAEKAQDAASGQTFRAEHAGGETATEQPPQANAPEDGNDNAAE